MTDTIDQLLERINRLSASLAADGLTDAERSRLERERDGLRARARELADQRRHPASIEAEITMLEQRLAEIDGFLITKGHSEKYLSRTIQDPSAYSTNINAMLSAQHEDEVSEIRDRLERLRELHAASSSRTPEAGSPEAT